MLLKVMIVVRTLINDMQFCTRINDDTICTLSLMPWFVLFLTTCIVPYLYQRLHSLYSVSDDVVRIMNDRWFCVLYNRSTCCVMCSLV